MTVATMDLAITAVGKAAKDKLANPAATGAPEDQLRGPLEELVKALAPLTSAKAAVLVGETSLAELQTRPDYSVTVRDALVGFIEVKAPGKGANPKSFNGHDRDQWAKLKALPNLLYTDGNQFGLYRDGTRVGDIVKLSGDVESSGATLSAPATLLPLIEDFLSWTPIAPKSPKALAETTARLCRFLRDEVAEQLGQKNPALTGLYEDWQTLLFPEANHDEFADGYAQAVTFGLLMARSQDLSLTDDLDQVAKKLGQTNTLIGTALRLLTDEPEEVLSPSLGTLRRVLGVVDWETISKGDPEAWIYFYERFLTVYDSALRRKSGSYYTPPQVVQTMVRLCDEALRAPGRFAKPAGLADPAVHIADPAMGSSTFLLALLRRIAKTVEDRDGAGAVGGAITEAARRLYGFELQFGAFAVAQLRMVAEMMALGASGEPHLYVTDTLGDPMSMRKRAPAWAASCPDPVSRRTRSSRASRSPSSSAIRPTKMMRVVWAAGLRTGPRTVRNLRWRIGRRRRVGTLDCTPTICATFKSIFGGGRRGKYSSRAAAAAIGSRRSRRSCRGWSATSPWQVF